MVLLGIYLGTTIATLSLGIITEKAWNKRLEREGYIDLDQEKSRSEKVDDFIHFLFYVSILPIISLGVVCAIALSDKAYQDAKRSGIINGTIIKKSDETIEEEKTRKIRDIINKEKEKKAEIQQNKPIALARSYSEMDPIEKLEFLEAERDALLKQIEENEKKEEKRPVKAKRIKVPVKKIGTR